MKPQHTTRRAVLAGASALPTLTVPALAIEHPDAELLRLSEQLAVVEREWEARDANFRHRSQIYHTACKQADLDPDLVYSDFETYGQFTEYLNKCSALWPESKSEYDDETKTNEFVEREHALIEKILLLKATTVAGLAVQTRAMVLANAHIWDWLSAEYQENYPEQRRERQFLEATCNYLGIEPPPIRLRNVAASLERIARA